MPPLTIVGYLSADQQLESFDYFSLVLGASSKMAPNGGCSAAPGRADASNKTPGFQGTTHERRRVGNTASRIRGQTGTAEGRSVLQRNEARAPDRTYARTRVLRGRAAPQDLVR